MRKKYVRTFTRSEFDNAMVLYEGLISFGFKVKLTPRIPKGSTEVRSYDVIYYANRVERMLLFMLEDSV